MVEEEKRSSTEPLPYRVVSFWKAHEADVRCLVADARFLFSGGRDCTVRAWNLSSLQSPAVATLQLPAWVNTLAVSPQGFIAAGLANGAIVLLRPLADAGLREIAGRQLAGHDAPVCSLSWNPDGKTLISGGWDGTARMWDVASRSCCEIFAGHENNVCVLAWGDNVFLTGSTGLSDGSGCQIRLWSGNPVAVSVSLTDHRAGIRDLCAVSAGNGFASASNDGTVRVWDSQGTAIATLDAPTGSFVFCVDSFAQSPLGGPEGGTAGGGGCVLAFGDDEGHLVVCNSGGGIGATQAWKRQQVLGLGSTVWAVTCHSPTGMIFAGCADGNVYCCSRDPALPEVPLPTPPEADGTASASGAVAYPAVSELAEHVGRLDGQISLFDDGGTIRAFQWAAGVRMWHPLGVAAAPQRRIRLGDELYDMIIPVELDSASRGFLELQLGFNFGELPRDISRAFCAKHGLGDEYLPQIESFLAMHIATT